MNNERYNQIIDEAYENYCKEYEKDNSVGMLLLVQRVDGKSVYRKPDIERFIALCTHEKTFSERWGLKIEERELSLEERAKLLSEKIGREIKETTLHGENQFEVEVTQDSNALGIPTKLIILTYKDEKIEVYEN